MITKKKYTPVCPALGGLTPAPSGFHGGQTVVDGKARTILIFPDGHEELKPIDADWDEWFAAKKDEFNDNYEPI